MELLLVLVGLQVLLTPAARRLARTPARHDRIAAAAAVAVPLLLLLPWLRADVALAPTGVLDHTLPGRDDRASLAPWSPSDAQLNDVVLQILPWEAEVRRALAAGRAPFWSDALDGGSDLWSNPQTGVASPIALLARLFPLGAFLLASLACKMSVALRGTAVLARALGVRTGAALLAAVGVACGGAVLAWGLFPHSSTLAFVPWVAAAALAVRRRPGRAPALLMACFVAALLLSGHPETAAAGLAFALALALALGRPRAWARGLLPALLALGVGAALSAPLWVPFVAALPGTARVRDRRLAARAEPPSFAARAEAVRQSAVITVDGRAFGSPYERRETLWPVTAAPFCGGALAVAALVGLFRAPRRRSAVLLALWVALVFAPAWSPGLLPGPLAWAESTRAAPVGALALALAAALGVDRLLRLGAAAVWRVALPAAALALLAALLLRVPGEPPLGAVAAISLLSPALLVGLLPRRVAVACLLVWSLCELVPWGRSLLPRGQVLPVHPHTAVLSRLHEAVAAGGPWRVAGAAQIFPPALAALSGYDEVRPHNPLARADVLAVLDSALGYREDTSHYFGRLAPGGHPLLSFLNVRALVSNVFERAPAGFAPCGTSGMHLVWCNPGALPRWFLPSGVDVVGDPDLPAWIHSLTDPRRVSVPATEAPLLAGDETGRRTAGVRAIRVAPGDVELAVGGRGRRLLATSLPGPRGWSVDTPGGSLPRLTIDGAYLGATVPPGVRRIRLRYVPPGLAVGVALAGLGLAGLAALGWPRRAASPKAV